MDTSVKELAKHLLPTKERMLELKEVGVKIIDLLDKDNLTRLG